MKLPGRLVWRWNAEGLDLIARWLRADRVKDILMSDQLVRLPAAVRQYLALFNLIAICVRSDDRIGVVRNITGAVAAWWTVGQGAAKKIARLARKDQHPVAEAVTAAAAELGVPLTEHTVVIARATAATARIARAVGQANATGGLSFLNREYKRARAAAIAVGRPFPSYGQARAQLQQAIAKGAAAGGEITPALIASVLG
jgi:hypothetical protein